MQRLKGQAEPSRRLAGEERDEAQDEERRFLVFRLGDSEFALPIEAVDEVARVPETITRLPRAPKFLEGVVNLRGVIVPIVDLRLRFGMHDATYDALTVVIVLNVANRVVGIVVDSVSDVVELGSEHVRSAPAVGSVIDAEFIDGLGALVAWVERGEAPARIEAAKVVDGQPVRTRPLCPYPQVARYRGTGSIDEAASFACVMPEAATPRRTSRDD